MNFLRNHLGNIKAHWELLQYHSPSLGNGPTVVMTTHGKRMLTAHHAVKCLLCGFVRPSRFFVYVPSEPTPNLRALEQYGVTVVQCEPHGVHDKWYHYAQSYDDPFVTVDDDCIYPKDFLAKLAAAHASAPYYVTGMRVRRIVSMRFSEWPLAGDTLPSHKYMALGCGGVMYPTHMVRALRRTSFTKLFLSVCPKADDIWLKRIEVEAGILVRPAITGHVYPMLVPGTPGTGLWEENRTGNDPQWLATLTPAMLKHIYDTPSKED